MCNWSGRNLKENGMPFCQFENFICHLFFFIFLLFLSVSESILIFYTSEFKKPFHYNIGLAPVAGMCTATSSCTINEGKHFESVFVVAHEIGHKYVFCLIFSLNYL